jgi:hypothetical protein
MSKLFDGTDEPLTYGQALVAIAERLSWQSEAHQKEVVLAIQTEHDIVPVEDKPRSLANDPRDLTLAAQDDEIALLKRQLERAELQAKVNEAEARAREGQQVKDAPVFDTPAPPAVADPFPHLGKEG